MLYAFVRNNASDSVDPWGEDRYITWFDLVGIGGSGGTQTHVGVAVDTWQCGADGRWTKAGQVTFDFSVDWDAGWWNLFWGAIWSGRGRISESPGLVLDSPIAVRSTACQDRKMLEMIRGEAADPPFYSFLFHNCMFWSVGALQYGMQEQCSECCSR